ncbi:hypothetical protein [Faecalicatena orotica]
MEIYSLQDWYLACSTRDYWVEMDIEGEKAGVNAFYLPTRD